MDPEALLEGLDDAQRAAVTSTAMPLVVLAPAGSGKTRVLTRRIAYRVATGSADPRHVLALTFTRKAAGELDERLRRLGLRGDATTGTFHAVAWATLRTRWADLGRSPLTLLDRKGRLLAELAPSVPGKDKRTVAGELATEIEWAKARMVTPDDYVDAVAPGGAQARPPARAGRRGLRGVRAPQAPRRPRRLRRPARAGRPGPRGGRGVRGGAALAVPPPLRRRAPGREPAPVPPAPGVARRPLRRDRGRRPAAGDLRVERRRRRLPPRHPPLVAAGRGHRAHAQLPVDARDPRGRRRRAPRPAGSRLATVHATRAAGAPPLVRGHADDRAEAVAIARAIRLAPRTRAAVVRAGGARAHPRARPTSSPRRSARPASPTGFAGRRRSSIVPRSDEPSATLRDATRAAGHRAGRPRGAGRGAGGPQELVDLGDDEDTRAGRARAPGRRAGRPGRAGPHGPRLPAARSERPSRQPGGVAHGHGAVRGRRGRPARDAVDVATFHAAKGLEWATVHLAGAEDGFVPIAHARTAAAKAEEVRLLYVAMTRAERELRISLRRAAHLQRASGRPATVTAPRPAARGAGTPSRAAARRARRRRPGRAGQDELARQRDALQASRTGGDRRSWRPCERGATSPPAPPASSRRPCCPTTCWRGWRRRARATSRRSVRSAASVRSSPSASGRRSSTRSRSATWHEVHDRAAVRRRRRRGGAGLRQPGPVRRAGRAAEAVPARRASPTRSTATSSSSRCATASAASSRRRPAP